MTIQREDASVSDNPSPIIEYKPKYRLTRNNGFYLITFFCAFCDFHHTVNDILVDSEAQALALGDMEARKHFNGCHKCKKWVCDIHFDMAKMLCTECSAAELAELHRRINIHDKQL